MFEDIETNKFDNDLLKEEARQYFKNAQDV